MDKQKALSLIEQQHLLHFRYLPQKLGFEIDERNGLHLIHAGLGSSMFNIVYGAPSVDTPRQELLKWVMKVFKGQPFAWWIPPSQKDETLSAWLLSSNFFHEADEDAMLCELSDYQRLRLSTDLNIEQVKNKQTMDGYIDLLQDYDDTSADLYTLMTNRYENWAETLYVGKVGQKVAVIAILYCHQNVASIFGLITREEMRGRGFGGDMMKYLLNVAKQNGADYVTLSASSDSGYRIYERLGFKRYGEFECFEMR